MTKKDTLDMALWIIKKMGISHDEVIRDSHRYYDERDARMMLFAQQLLHKVGEMNNDDTMEINFYLPDYGKDDDNDD